jgi:hypothetical protein
LTSETEGILSFVLLIFVFFGSELTGDIEGYSSFFFEFFIFSDGGVESFSDY